MNISKTQFKKYTRCPRCYALDNIYQKKLDSSIEVDEELLEILREMFDEETGEEFITIDEKTLAMLEYYKDVEREAIKQANMTFFSGFKYEENTKNQTLFSYTDDNQNVFYSYLDGYNENEKEAIVIEVKATTTSKVKKMGYSEKGEFIPLFFNDKGILKVRSDFANYEKLKSSYDKLFNRYNDVGKYVYDIAVERYIIEKSGKKAKNKNYKYYLAMLNNEYIFDGKYENNSPIYEQINNQILINFIDVTDITFQYLELIEKEKDILVKNILSNELPTLKMVEGCRTGKIDECGFFPICFSKLKENGSILEVIGPKNFTDNDKNKYSLEKMINLGYYSLGDIPMELLQDQNKLIQRECFDNKTTYINKNKLSLGLNEIRYPIYHLDFEGFPCPLPRFRGEKPYSQSLFQFSLHIEKKPGVCDYKDDCYSFLAEDFSDCREKLIKKMISLIDLSKGGSTLVYNKNYECTRISELMNIFPNYYNELKRINESIFDLLDIIKTKKSLYMDLGLTEEESKTVNYYSNDLHGSYSIKKVLPIFSDLSYKNLEIKNGNEAIVAYSQFKFLTKEEIEELRSELIKYCSQDTWSMVVILDGIRNLVMNKK